MNKKFIDGRLWIIYFTTLFIIGIISLFLLATFLPFFWSFIVMILVLIFGLFILFPAYKEVPHNRQLIIEVMGKYIGKPIESDWYFLFPLFSFVFVKDDFFMGECTIDLFGEDDNDLVDFKDGVSARLNAKLFYYIIDSEKASYNVSDFEKAVKEIAQSAVRAYAGSNTFDYCNENKARIILEMVCNADLIEKIRNEWGIMITRLTISDIELSVLDIEIRRKLKEAEVNLKISKKDAAKKIVLSEAEKESLNLLGEGLAGKIAHMSSRGLSTDQITDYLKEELKWLNVGDKTVIIDGGAGLAGIIAQLKTLGNNINTNTGGTV